MTTRKKKSTASKQRAKARQQQRAAAAARAAQDPQAASAVSTAPQPIRREGDRPPRASQRRRSRTPWVLVGGVVAVVGLLVVMFITRPADDTERGNATEGSIDKLLNVPVETLEAVGVPAEPTNVNVLPVGTPAVEEGGKPLMFYYGADYCPFCAVERWAMVVALSRFGTFTDLESTTSAPPPETLPNTATVSFHGSSFTSDHLAFSAVETHTRTFELMETPTDFQQQLFDTLNVKGITGSNGGIPFVMIGNRYAWAGSQYDYTVLEGKDFDQIVTELRDPATDTAREIGGAANYLTAMICQLTDGQPADVCSSDVIQQAQAALPAA